MADHFDAGKFGAIVPFTFYIQDATTGASDTDLQFTADTTTVTMPYSGSVVGISVGASADVVGGAATFKAHKASAEYADSGAPAVVLNETNSNAAYGTIRPGVLKFSAGQKVGVSVTTSSDLDPTNSADFTAVLWVQLNAI